MGVRKLVGEQNRDAVMYDSTDGWPVGPIWFGVDASEQIEAFLSWMQTRAFLALTGEIGLGGDDIPDPQHGAATDPRAWPKSGLEKLVKYWRSQHLDEEGWLKEEVTTDV